MSGARGFYLLTETIKTSLLSDENVNTVTTGDITKIDLSKQTIYLILVYFVWILSM